MAKPLEIKDASAVVVPAAADVAIEVGEVVAVNPASEVVTEGIGTAFTERQLLQLDDLEVMLFCRRLFPAPPPPPPDWTLAMLMSSIESRSPSMYASSAAAESVAAARLNEFPADPAAVESTVQFPVETTLLLPAQVAALPADVAAPILEESLTSSRVEAESAEIPSSGSGSPEMAPETGTSLAGLAFPAEESGDAMPSVFNC